MPGSGSAVALVCLYSVLPDQVPQYLESHTPSKDSVNAVIMQMDMFMNHS